VGIFYNNGEINSITMAQLMVNALQKTDITPLLIGVSSEVEIEPALLSAMPKVDAIITPIDNMVATSIALIVHIMEKVQKPLIVSDNMLVKEGALMSRGIDYYASGKQAGKIAIDIVMNNKTPDVINIIKSSTKQIFVNKQVAQKYNVIIPQDLEKDIIFV
jgi:putative ABC transport system substrate-binding protein